MLISILFGLAFIFSRRFGIFSLYTGATKDMGGEQHGLPPIVVAENIYNGIVKDRYEIFVGEAGRQYADYFADPETAIARFNQGFY